MPSVERNCRSSSPAFLTTQQGSGGSSDCSERSDCFEAYRKAKELESFQDADQSQPDSSCVQHEDEVKQRERLASDQPQEADFALEEAFPAAASFASQKQSR